MTQTGKCDRCGGQNLHAGTLNSTGRVGFRPEHTRFMVWHTADVEVRAKICLDCGAIQLTGDAEKTRALIESIKTAPAGA